MDSFGDAVTQLQSAEAGGFDFSPAQAASLLNEGVKRLASRSWWVKAQVELGPTVVAQTVYALPDSIVKLKEVAIGGIPYTAVDLRTVWDLEAGIRELLSTYGGGVFAESFSEDGKTKTFTLFPAPEESGLAIASLAAVIPADLVAGDTLPFPPDYRRAVVDYAKGIAYEDIDENPQSGTYFMNRANATADELRMEAQSRSGAGPYKIPVASLRSRGRR